MITLDCEQYSEEWFAARVGIPSASSFDKIVTAKGEPSKQSKDYLYGLAGERLTGIKTETYSNANMQRGLMLEAEARDLFQMVTGIDIHEVGLCYPDDEKRYSCSPDGINSVEGLEIKSPLIHTHVSYLLADKLPTKYTQQVQGSMLVTGFDRWNFVSYYPGLPPLMIVVERDEAFIANLEAALEAFNYELDAVTEQLKIMEA